MSSETKAIIEVLIRIAKFALSQFENLLRDEKNFLHRSKSVGTLNQTGEPP